MNSIRINIRKLCGSQHGIVESTRIKPSTHDLHCFTQRSNSHHLYGFRKRWATDCHAGLEISEVQAFLFGPLLDA